MPDAAPARFFDRLKPHAAQAAQAFSRSERMQQDYETTALRK